MQIDIANLDRAGFTWFYADIFQIKEYLMQTENAVITATADISHVLNSEYVYSPNPQKAVFCAVDSCHCVMFSNLYDGWNSLVHHIVNHLHCKAFFVEFTDDKNLLALGNYFQYFSRNACRTVYAIKESRWVFYEEGSPRDFECIEYYQQPIKKKRLTKDILLQYCTKLQIIKDGLMTVDLNSCFTFELFWRNSLHNDPNAGSIPLQEKETR